MNASNALDLVEEDKNTDINNAIVGKTKGGKNIAIFTGPNGLWQIKFTTGGELPKRLKGSFTKYEVALGCVEAYLVSEPDPVKKVISKKKRTSPRKPEIVKDHAENHSESQPE